MSRPTQMAETDITSWLADHPLWVREGQKLTRSFHFSTFARAFAFMTEIAIVAEKLDHHPEWFNVYNRVDVAMTTHDAGGITELDTSLCEMMDSSSEL